MKTSDLVKQFCSIDNRLMVLNETPSMVGDGILIRGDIEIASREPFHLFIDEVIISITQIMFFYGLTLMHYQIGV